MTRLAYELDRLDAATLAILFGYCFVVLMLIGTEAVGVWRRWRS